MSLDALWNDLTADLTADPRGPGVARILEDYAAGADDWREFALYRDDGCYARNLIGANELFELILLCWGPGQQSPIHNHEGQRCWMTTLEGEIEETHYSFRQGAPPVPGATRVYRPGGVTFITDDIALHRIRPRNGQGGVSLHLYSKPIRACRLYCERTGAIEWAQMSYYSVRGELQPEA